MDARFYPPKMKEGKIVAFADVGLANGVIVKGFRIVRDDGGLAAAVPMRSYSAAGKTRWFPLVAFSSAETRDRFLAALLDDFERWRNEEESSRVTSASG